MKTLTLTFLGILTCFATSCSKKLHITAEKYEWKSYDKITEQSVNLDKYKSPNLRPNQNKDQLVVVCASGGGARAAAFTIGCLLELEHILVKPNETPVDSQLNVANEIDYFSTVSGGGWGAGAYLAYKYQNYKYGNSFKTGVLKNDYPTFNSYEEWLGHFADRRYAQYQLRYFLSGKSQTSGNVMMDRLNSGYLGWTYRALIEEELWKKNPAHKLKDGITQFYQDSVQEIMLSDVFTLATSSKLPKLPMFIANSTNIDNYELVPFTPDRLNFWGVRQYRYTTANGAQKSPLKIEDVLPIDSLLEVPLVAGIKASSSVTSFIGASSFPAQRAGIKYHLHLEDGGLIDNLGLHTAKAILRQETGIKDSSKRILIIIDASSCGIASTKRIKHPNVGRLYSALRIWPPKVPDIQYPLNREDIGNLEKEYNCKVIYLGNDILLDSKLGLAGSIPKDILISKKLAEENFHVIYDSMLRVPDYFSKNVTMEQRSVLYAYIEKYLHTWFAAKGTTNHGTKLIPPNEMKGYAKVMFLAGRAVVQLKKEIIVSKFNVK